MASSLSRGSRPIGPAYNDTKRSARRLSRQGFDREAGTLALLAEQQKLAGGGSNITSAEGNRDERDAIEVAQSGLSRERRDAVLKGNAAEKGLTVEATGPQLAARKGLYERMRSGVTPEMKAEAANLGITDSGFAQASTSAGQNRLAPAAGVTAPTTLNRPIAPALGRSNPNGNAEAPAVSVDAYGNVTAPADTSPAALTRPAAATAPEPRREGKIDGMPASKAIAALQSQDTKSATQGRIDTMGLDGAIADYHRRQNTPQEPGNLAELKARDEGGAAPAPAGPVGPLQTALLEARKRREARAAEDDKKNLANPDPDAKVKAANFSASMRWSSRS